MNFSVRGKTSYFPWMLSIYFGINKMASLNEKGVKTFHRNQAIAVASCFCEKKYSYSFLVHALEKGPRLMETYELLLAVCP